MLASSLLNEEPVPVPVCEKGFRVNQVLIPIPVLQISGTQDPVPSPVLSISKHK
jgi:hypothetical protein